MPSWGLGGGSAMDFAKALAIIMTHGGSLGDYVGEGLVPSSVIPRGLCPYNFRDRITKHTDNRFHNRRG